DHHADGLGRTGGGRNDVFQDAAATAPVLVGRTVDDLLAGGGGVDGGHQAALDAPLVVQHLGDRGQAVGGAGGIGDDRLALVGLVVHAEDEHRGVVLGRRRQDHLLRTGIDVLLRGFLGQEQAGGLDHHVHADLAPLQVGRVTLLGQADRLAVDHDVLAFDLDIALEAAVDGVVLQHVGQVIRLQQVVDRNHFDVV